MSKVSFFSLFTSSLKHSSANTKNSNAYNSTCIMDIAVYQQPRKQKRCAAHKCVIYWYLKVAKFSLTYFQNYKANFYQIYIFCLTYTLLHISKLKKITSALLEIFVPKIAQFSSHFSSPLHKITNIFKSHKYKLPMF